MAAKPFATVREMRLVEAPSIPPSDRYGAAEQAHAARVLSHQMAEQLSTYGAQVVFQALALALAADMAPAAEQIHAPRLAAMYTAAATMLQGMAPELARAELNRS